MFRNSMRLMAVTLLLSGSVPDAPAGAAVSGTLPPAADRGTASFRQGGLPAYLPRYRLAIDLDVVGRLARVRQTATWTNPTGTGTDRLVFNAHSRYVVPDDQVGFMAKMLEILRVQPSEALGEKEPACEIHQVRLDRDSRPLAFHYEGDTKTTLVVPLPCPVGPGESVTVVLDMTVRIPAKQGRWGQWEGVTQLSNWLPVFAYYGEGGFGPIGRGQGTKEVPATPRLTTRGQGGPGSEHATDAGPAASWRPVPFVPWHQPFFNESGIYEAAVTLPGDQLVACTGAVLATTRLPEGKQRLDIEALGVREFTLIASSRFRAFEGCVNAGPGGAPVRIRVLAFPEHAFYARHMVRISADALAAYSKWFGPYPWPVFSIAESFFGWNGNECSTLVMVDDRVFAMPEAGVGYVEYLVSHEICHQWWYNLVGTNGYCETWMDEALANYFSHRLLTLNADKNNNLISYPRGLEWLPNVRRDDYRSCGMYGTFGRGENGPVIREMPRFGHLGNLFNLCYDKGGRIVGMIAERLHEAAFSDFVRVVARKYRYRILGVADFRRELEEYTGHSWREFFDRWLYGPGLSDWSVEKVTVIRSPRCQSDPLRHRLSRKRLAVGADRALDEPVPPGSVRMQVWLSQTEEYDEPTTLGIALPGHEGYPVRIPIVPGAGPYQTTEPPARITPLPPAAKGGTRILVEAVLPDEPTQVTVDPDQVIVDREPANNYWHPPIRWRLTPLYTFVEETDLTNAYDRWNVILGPWVSSPAYNNAWFTQSPMLGLRAGAYRTQQFSGGAYAGYRTDFRDVVVGIDGVWDHWPLPKSQVGYLVERRLGALNDGDPEATRAALWGRYVFMYSPSMYTPPAHFVEAFAQYSDNFLPFPTQGVPSGVRYDRTSTLGLHYRVNYLTPYWDPEGGFRADAWYEGGVAQEPSTVGLHKVAGLFAGVWSLPDLRGRLGGPTWLQDGLGWLARTRVAFRAYGATAAPRKGEFYSMGGSELFRGFDLAQRQGSSVWVGSVEWRVPLAQRLDVGAIDHVIGLRNAHAALFYDVGDAYTNGRSAGPVAHGVGMGLRLDVSWFSFVERTTLRLDVAKAVNLDTGVQVWIGLNHPF